MFENNEVAEALSRCQQAVDKTGIAHSLICVGGELTVVAARSAGKHIRYETIYPQGGTEA